jgi:hypothetical protein
MRGRPFGFMALLCITWISARAMILSYGAREDFSQLPVIMNATPWELAAIAHPTPGAFNAYRVPHSPNNSTAPLKFIASFPSTNPSKLRLHLASVPKLDNTSSAVIETISSRFAEPLPSAFILRFEPAFVATNESRLSVYAYSFWRKGSAPAGFALYGGGQSAVTATYRLGSGLSLLGRASVAHNDADDREVATGLRLSLTPRLPVSLTAERRFRRTGKDVFAAYLSGGESGLKLPLKFRLDAFGQAGVISGKYSRYFFDAQAKVDRAFISSAPIPVRAGAGIWTGGQKGISRLDIGPSLGTEIPLDSTRIRVDADWRFRVAGDAKPSNGPALTLSTSF